MTRYSRFKSDDRYVGDLSLLCVSLWIRSRTAARFVFIVSPATRRKSVHVSASFPTPGVPTYSKISASSGSASETRLIEASASCVMDGGGGEGSGGGGEGRAAWKSQSLEVGARARACGQEE